MSVDVGLVTKEMASPAFVSDVLFSLFFHVIISPYYKFYCVANVLLEVNFIIEEQFCNRFVNDISDCL